MKSPVAPLLVGLCLSLTIFTVASADPLPPSAVRSLRPAAEVAHVEAPALTADLLTSERKPQELGAPLRVGHPLKVHLTPASAGTWETLEDGTRVWRVRLSSRGAQWLMLGLGVFRPVPGAMLWAYNDSRTSQYGPYTVADEQTHGQLWIGPVIGDGATLELLWPSQAQAVVPNIELNVVSHGFRGFGEASEKRLGDSGSCNIDVMCPLGANWQDEKRGTLMYLKSGSDWCSGSLINNTAQNCKPLVLTAHHCFSTQAELNSMTWVFNFERSACGSGSASTAQQIAGGTLRSTSSASDFTLIELNQAVPDAWAPYYNGWSRSTSPATQATGIHHPSGDAKKISRDDSGTINGSQWGSNHWRVPSWDQGVTEGGSSGSPLFDQNSRIIGQLHGGESSCSLRTWDEYGKLDVSWIGGGTAATRLRDWLDPENLLPTTLDGLDYSICLVPHADLKYDSHTIDDSSGNANGAADPGETFLLPTSIANVGNTPATGVSGTLATAASGVTIVDNAAVWPDVPNAAARGSLAPHFQLSLADTVSCGSLVPVSMTNNAAAPAGTWNSNFNVRVGQAQVNTNFQDNVEAGVGGWTQQRLEGTLTWAIVTSDSNSPTHSWFLTDADVRTDTLLIMQPLNNLPAESELKFFHKYRTENNYDGGVLEYSLDGGAFVDASALIVEGGYSASVSSSASSPLAGRPVWGGDSNGWTAVRANLSTLAGRNVRLRWRFASDTSVLSTGWFIDDVTVKSTSYVCAPVVTRPGEASGLGATPLQVNKVVGGYGLSWGAPLTGGAPSRYKLYRYALPMLGSTTPDCESDLGTSTSTTLATLTDNAAFVVVARNTAGEGSYGQTSAGSNRPVSLAPCP